MKRNPGKSREYQKRYQKKYREENPDRELGKRMRQYGITAERFREMERDQKGLCAICGTRGRHKRLALDHDHTTGRIRGLLCSDCNWMLGHAKDDTASLESAAAYLRKHQVTP